MATDLEVKLKTILNEKKEKIIPENIKKGVKILGVEGELEIGAEGDTELYEECKELTTKILYGDSLVPSTFEQLKYIEGTGEQYIKLDCYDSYINAGVLFDIRAVVQFTDITDRNDGYITWCVNGVAAGKTVTLSSYKTFLHFGWTFDPATQGYKFCYSPCLNSADVVTTVPADTEKHVFHVVSNANKSDAGFWIDGEHVETQAATSSATKFGFPFYIFAYENTRGILPAKQRLYRFQLLNDDGSSFYDLVPAKRKADNAIGLYDIASGKFFTNNGTGEFLYGEY